MRTRHTAAAAALLLAACSDATAPSTGDYAQLAPLAQPAVLTASITRTDLAAPAGTGPVGTELYLGSINSQGWIVGTASAYFEPVTWHQVQRAMLWTDAGAVNLGNLPPHNTLQMSWGRDVNDDGVVVGWGHGGGTQQAFRWTAATGMQALLPLAAGKPAQASAINNAGVIAGQATAADGTSHAVLWTDPALPPADLGTLGGASASFSDINDAGVLIGTSSLGGFVHRPGLGTVQLGAEALPLGISGTNIVVGFRFTDDGVRAFRWTEAGGMEDLGTPAGGTGNTQARSVNAAGQIAATAEVLDESGSPVFRPFLWVAGQWFDLSDAETPAGAAVGINDALQIAGGRMGGLPGADRPVRWEVVVSDVPPAPVFAFDGFRPPVANLPAVNSVRAGSSVPVKFSLGGDHGLAVFADGFPRSVPVACGGGTVPEPVEETAAAGASGLTYDPLADQYTYVWKTSKAWSGSCRRLVVRLADGTEHQADFIFDR